MGQPMAGKLLDAGHELWICDIREDAMQPLIERQARPTASPKELADACDMVVISLPTLSAFRQAVSGPKGLLSGTALKTIVNTCTVGKPFLAEIEQACAAAGVMVIDAPIRAWGKTNESQVKNPKRHKKAGKESGNYDSMAA